MSANDHPYRAAADPPPQFICVACYRTASVEGGNCSKCGSVRVPLENEDVKADVRAHAERVRQRLFNRGVAVTVIGSTLAAVAVYAVLVQLHVIAFRWVSFRGPDWLAPIWIVCVCAGGALYALIGRRRSRAVDAFSAPIADLLEFLGVMVE